MATETNIKSRDSPKQPDIVIDKTTFTFIQNPTNGGNPDKANNPKNIKPLLSVVNREASKISLWLYIETTRNKNIIINT